MIRAFGLWALVFAPAGLIEFVVESAWLPWLPTLSVDHLLCISLNVVSMSAAIRLFKPGVSGVPMMDAVPAERKRVLNLSGREVEIAVLIARGYANKQIAAELGISPATVRTHIYNLYQKVGARSRVELLSRCQVERRAAELMEKSGIAEIAANEITQASGGQLQRVGICRALINEPDVIFGDKPTGALKSRSSGEIMDLLGGVHREGTTVMLVSHDIQVASRSERVLFMTDGRIVAEKQLGAYRANGSADGKAREAELARWLLELGF